MNKQKILKNSMIGVTIISLFTMANLNKSYAAMNCNKVTEEEVKYANASFLDINPEAYNEMIRGMSPDIYYPQSIDTREGYDKKALLFGSAEGMMVGGIQNGFTGPNIRSNCHGVVQGLVQDKLQNGNLVVANQYSNGKTLFNMDSSQTLGWDKPYDQILQNWKFPFLKEDNGYYSFNSEKYHVEKNYSTKTFKLHEGARNGFYPFNDCQDNTFIDSNKALYFSGKIEIPFLMTSDGKVKNKATGNYDDMIFNFSGDDDVWVFVDDSLVLDLGGVHIKQTGNINFAKNQVYYASVYNKENNYDSYDVYKTAFSTGKLTSGKHTLKIFYMERAGGESNLFASFNLQSSGVKTNYIEKYTGKILGSEIKTGAIGDKIKCEAKEFTSHKLCEKPQNEDITLKEDLQTVNYYYINQYNLNAEYIDISDNSKISQDVTEKIYEDERYKTTAKEIKNYTLVKTSGETEGIMPHTDKTIKYYYKYNCASATANYIDKTSGEKLNIDTKVGNEGDIKTFEEKKFENYALIEKPTSNDITLTKKEQIINYYYIHQSKITVNYIDKDTNENLEKIEENVNEGTIYKTELKEFENYKNVEKPEGQTYIIKKENIEVNYYYKKLKFNLKIDMNLNYATINDRYYELKGKIGKVESEIKEANSESTVKIGYTIKVTNDQERVGSGTITVEIPDGYVILPEDNPKWDINENNVSYKVEKINPNETREYQLILKKNSNNDICGVITNKVKIQSDGIEETTLKDNKDSNDLLIMPRTGGRKLAIYGIMCLCLIALFVLIRI